LSHIYFIIGARSRHFKIQRDCLIRYCILHHLHEYGEEENWIMVVISRLGFCDAFHYCCFVVASFFLVDWSQVCDIETLKLCDCYCPYMAISWWMYAWLFQISFVIDERLRGKGYKRKVTSFPSQNITWLIDCPIS
jgi:hypothetical protein